MRLSWRRGDYPAAITIRAKGSRTPLDPGKDMPWHEPSIVVFIAFRMFRLRREHTFGELALDRNCATQVRWEEGMSISRDEIAASGFALLAMTGKDMTAGFVNFSRKPLSDKELFLQEEASYCHYERNEVERGLCS